MQPRIDAVQPVLGSRDLARSIRFYQQLGFALSFGGHGLQFYRAL